MAKKGANEPILNIRAPRGSSLLTKGWQQEGALRMLMNNLDPQVAEKPAELIVYGGTGKAARNWEAYRAIVASLKKLESDETLIVQSGKPVAVFKTHAEAPRVLISNAMIVPHWANWDDNSGYSSNSTNWLMAVRAILRSVSCRGHSQATSI